MEYLWKYMLKWSNLMLTLLKNKLYKIITKIRGVEYEIRKD